MNLLHRISDAWREHRIERARRAMTLAGMRGNPVMAYRYEREMSWLIRNRSAEQIARMEKQMGLAKGKA